MTTSTRTRKAGARSSPHEEMVIGMFREDPEFAAEYLNGVLEDGDQEELMLAMRREVMTVVPRSGASP